MVLLLRIPVHDNRTGAPVTSIQAPTTPVAEDETAVKQVRSQQDVALALARRVKDRDLQLRRRFACRSSVDEDEPPLAQMLRGGQGGQVRLKLYLSLLWVGVGAGNQVTFPAPTWATLLGLPDPEGKGSRRIRDALTWLATQGLIILQGGSGKPSTVTLLDDGGTKTPYVVPGIAIARAQKSEAPVTDDLYFKLPPTFWTAGWIVHLSGAAVAMLLVLLSEQRGRSREFWMSPRIADDRYVISEDTRSRGVHELQRHHLLDVHRRPVRASPLDTPRYRNTYVLHIAMLDPPDDRRTHIDGGPAPGDGTTLAEN
jgi:hypothetical protein